MSTPSPSPPLPPPSPLQTRLLTRFPSLARLHLLSPTIPLPSLLLSFALLHELTAVLPVAGIFFGLRSIDGGKSVVRGMIKAEGAIRGTTSEGTGWVQGWVVEGERKLEWVGGRYGVLGFEKKVKGQEKVVRKAGEREAEDADGSKKSGRGELGKGVAGDVANALGAYMIVKALLPLRIGASVYLSPFVARTMIMPVQRIWPRGLGSFRRWK